MRWFRYSSLFVIALVLVRWSFYTVDAAEFAYVTVLGEPTATFDGASGDGGAGLHVGWPWPIQTVQRLDRRLQQFDLPATELLTHDPEGKTIDKMILVEAYVLWRIADRDAVDRFVKRLGSPERARSILGPRINGQLGAAVAQLRMDDLVSVDAGAQPGATRVDDTLSRLQAKLLDGLRVPVHDEYGIELVDIRLRRITYPSALSNLNLRVDAVSKPWCFAGISQPSTRSFRFDTALARSATRFSNVSAASATRR